MQNSIRFQVFAISCFLIASFSIAYLSNTMTIWDGAESSFLNGLQDPSRSSFIPYFFNHLFSSEGGEIGTIPRLMGLSIFTLALGFFYFSSIPLIGKKTAIITVLISISSFTLPILAKIATADIWLFSFQLMAYVSMIRAIKKPDLFYRSLFYLLLAISLLIQPLSSIIIFLAAPTFIFLIGKERKMLLRVNPWLVVGLWAVLFHYTGFLYWQNDAFIFHGMNFGIGKFVLLVLIGMLPFSGYLLGMLRDLFYKLKRREEFTVLFFPVLLFAIIAQSSFVVFGLAILIAKQMIAYLEDNYPFGNWIKFGSVLNLTFSFFIAVGLMLKGLQEFSGLGFRVGLGFSIAYWSLGIVGIIGLFSKDKRLLWGGVFLNGLMSFLIMVSAIYPLIETKRDTGRRLINALGENAYINQVILSEKAPIRQHKMPLLIRDAYRNVTIDSLHTFEEIFQQSPPKTMVIFHQSQFDSSLLVQYPNMTTVAGWNDALQESYWSALSK